MEGVIHAFQTQRRARRQLRYLTTSLWEVVRKGEVQQAGWPNPETHSFGYPCRAWQPKAKGDRGYGHGGIRAQRAVGLVVRALQG